MVSRLILNLRMRADDTVHWTHGGFEMDEFPTGASNDQRLHRVEPLINASIYCILGRYHLGR